MRFWGEGSPYSCFRDNRAAMHGVLQRQGKREERGEKKPSPEGSILEGVLGFLESNYDRFHPRRSAVFTSGRYADDLVLLPRCICRSCFQRVILQVYGKSLHFKPSEDFFIMNGCIFQKVLDATAVFSFASFNVMIVHKNESFAFLGDESLHAKGL